MCIRDRYTRAWRITHELGHALSEQLIQSKYGPSRRYGRLGREMIGQRGKPPKVTDVTLPPLSAIEVQRAVEWEDTAFHIQRMLLNELGVTIDDATFAKEYNTNISDAIYRSITGEFGDPGEYGFMPNDSLPPLVDVLSIIQNTEDIIAESDGRAPTQGIDLTTWERITDKELRGNLLSLIHI